MVVCDGVLGSLPLLGQFAVGFLGERSRLESATADISFPSVQLELRCRSLLKLGLTAMLQGEPGYASTMFTSAAAQSKGHHSEIYAQATAYLMQCRYMDFRWSVAGSDVSGVELGNIFDLEAEIRLLQTRLRSANASRDPHSQKLRAMLGLQRAIISARPGVWNSLQIALARDVGIGSVTDAIEDCRFRGIEDAQLLPFKIELAHIYRILGDHSRFHSEMQNAVPEPADWLLCAHHELRLGDAEAAPFGVPETWNMLLEQGTETNAPPKDGEGDHFASPPPEDLQVAAFHYGNADFLYRTAQYARGQAAIQLRLGYLATLGTIHSSTSSSTGSAASYKVALAHADRAKLLYSQAGDIAGVQVATVHACLCRLGLARFPEDTNTARTIGQWGRDKGSHSLAFGLGLFVAKYARRWLVFLGDYEKALAAHKLAAALFEGLGFKLSYAYSVYDQLSVYELLGDQNMIYITAEHAVDVCHDLTEEAQTPEISQRARNHAVNTLGRIFQRASKRADPERLERIADRLRQWQRPGGTISIEELQDRMFKLNQEIQAARNDGNQADREERLARIQRLNMAPVDYHTQATYSLIDDLVSTADALIPLYRGRKAARDGEWDTAESLWREAESVVRAHPNRNSDSILVSLSASRRDPAAVVEHAHAYRDRVARAQERRGAGIDQETRGLLQRQKWQDQVALLTLLARVRLHDDAVVILEGLEREWGPNWWSLYEYPVWDNLSVMGQVSQGSGAFKKAFGYFELAMDAFEKRRGQLSVDDHKVAIAGDSQVQELYFGAAHAAARWHLSTPESAADPLSPQIQRAFAALERGKARSLLDLIEGAIPHPEGDESLGPQWEEYRRQGTQLATLRGLLSRCYEAPKPDGNTAARLKVQIEDKERHLGKLQSELSAARGGTDPTSAIGTVLGLVALCRLLPEDTALLQYCYNRERLVTWKVTKAGITEVFVVDVPAVDLEGHILRYHKECATMTRRIADDDPESWLATRLLPFAALEEARLIIVPYSSLHQVPFHALPYQAQPLMASKTISYVPSASVLGYLQAHPSAQDTKVTVLAVGNPTDMSYQNPLTQERRPLAPLPSADLEASAIQELMADTKILTGPDATAENVSARLGQYTVLHFAAHGSLSAEVPMLSAIHLANGSSITVEALMWRRLRADLVVLSACKTGAGSPTDGDDVIGFARALLAAGVKSVVASLWVVNDDVTSFLMTRFYENLKQEWSPAKALRAAQRATRQARPKDVQAFLAQLRQRISERSRGTGGPEPVRATSDRQSGIIAPEIPRSDGDEQRGSGGGIMPETAPGQAAQLGKYSHPKYWAPFVVLGMQ